MYEKHLLSEYGRQQCDAKTTKYDKNKYLYSEVLWPSTYEDIYEIKQMLVDTGITKHIELARNLPPYDDVIGYTPPSSLTILSSVIVHLYMLRTVNPASLAYTFNDH